MLKIHPEVTIHFPNTENSQKEHFTCFVHPTDCFLKQDSSLSLKLAENTDHKVWGWVLEYAFNPSSKASDVT